MSSLNNPLLKKKYDMNLGDLSVYKSYATENRASTVQDIVSKYTGHTSPIPTPLFDNLLRRDNGGSKNLMNSSSPDKFREIKVKNAEERQAHLLGTIEQFLKSHNLYDDNLASDIARRKADETDGGYLSGTNHLSKALDYRNDAVTRAHELDKEIIRLETDNKVKQIAIDDMVVDNLLIVERY